MAKTKSTAKQSSPRFSSQFKSSRQKKSKNRVPLKPQDWKLGLEVVHPMAAGIDVGNSEHWVAVPPHLDAEPVRVFGCFTADLVALADWLEKLGIQTVAMQSTGVYWIPLADILAERGIRVFVVNARDTKNLPVPRATSRNVNGCCSCTSTACYTTPSGRRKRSCRCARMGGSGSSMWRMRRGAFNVCRKL